MENQAEQKSNVMPNEEDANLDLNDKNPNISCSVDEEVRMASRVEEAEVEVALSKVEKKQKKIILKQL